MEDNQKMFILTPEKNSKTPFETIIHKDLSKYHIEDVINMFFAFTEKIDLNITNPKSNKVEFLSYRNKNEQQSLKILIEVLVDNYGEECIIKELYKYIFVDKFKKNTKV